jgi:hypothetical protein
VVAAASLTPSGSPATTSSPSRPASTSWSSRARWSRPSTSPRQRAAQPQDLHRPLRPAGDRGGCASYATALHLMRTGPPGSWSGSGRGGLHHPRVLGHRRAHGHRPGRRGRGPHPPPGGDGPLRAGDRRRRHAHRRRRGQGDRLRGRRRDDRLAPGQGGRGPGPGPPLGMATFHPTCPRDPGQTTPLGTLKEILLGPARSTTAA